MRMLRIILCAYMYFSCKAIYFELLTNQLVYMYMCKIQKANSMLLYTQAKHYYNIILCMYIYVQMYIVKSQYAKVIC